MQNIAETTPVRNPRSINDRRSHQCARAGWRPRKRTPRQLAGDARGTQPSDFTPDTETQALVRQLVDADATPQR